MGPQWTRAQSLSLLLFLTEYDDAIGPHQQGYMGVYYTSAERTNRLMN